MAEKDKFADELLNDDELDNVTGGSMSQSINDLVRAGERGLCGFKPVSSIYDIDFITYVHNNWRSGENIIGNLKKMFESYGIDMIYNPTMFESNTYIYKGNEITQDDAWRIIDGKK